MKKTISLMFVFIVFYLGLMYFLEKKYNYPWAIAKVPQSANINDAPKDNLADLSVQDSVIEQGILPSENKNYLHQDLEAITKEQKNTEIKENQDKTEVETLTIEQTPQANVSQESVAQEPNSIQKPLTLKEQFEAKDLVDIETLPVKIFLDLRYATENNFTGQKLYKKAKCYLKKPAAKALEKAAKTALQADNPFYLCAYDCYRPASVQKILVNSTDQAGFVSRVSNHSRGMAIDIGPCDENGEALLTPTEFDTFSPLSAAYTYDDSIPQVAIENRTALQKVMKEAGFSTISKEWWHFDFKDAKQQEVLNIKF